MKKPIILLMTFVLSLSSCVITGNFDKDTDDRIPQPNTTGQHDMPISGTKNLADEIVAELNFVRTNPKQYAADVLEPRLKYFNGNMYAEPGKVRLLTQEGITPLQECIRVLKDAAVAEPLSLETGLCRSAQWLADDQARTGRLGHTGSDGSNLVTRISRYGTWGILCGENCAYGSKTAREIVVQLLIDDGVPDRGHRINILKQEFKKVGIGFNTDGNAPYGAVTVMDFAGSYISK